MARGPGRYDDLATLVRERAAAAGVVVIVLQGRYGEGFSVQTLDPTLVSALPNVLRNVADQIEADQEEIP